MPVQTAMAAARALYLRRQICARLVLGCYVNILRGAQWCCPSLSRRIKVTVRAAGQLAQGSLGRQVSTILKLLLGYVQCLMVFDRFHQVSRISFMRR